MSSQQSLNNYSNNIHFIEIINDSCFQKFIDVFIRKNMKGAIRIVGGAVRDILRNEKPDDVDFATTLTTPQIMKLFKEAGLHITVSKAVVERHIHAIVIRTLSVKDGNGEDVLTTKCEITTLEYDRRGCGRILFVRGSDWNEGLHRDFTINAMYLDLDGYLHDFYNGMQDLECRIVKFVGKTVDRLIEDPARILRFFRFMCMLKSDSTNYTNEIKLAFQQQKDKLAKISGRRIWTQLNKMVVTSTDSRERYAADALAQLLELSPPIGFPKEFDWTFNEVLFDPKTKYTFRSETCFGCLFRERSELNEFLERMDIGYMKKNLASFIFDYKFENLPVDKEERIQCLKQLLTIVKNDDSLAPSFVKELMYVRNQDDIVDEVFK